MCVSCSNLELALSISHPAPLPPSSDHRRVYYYPDDITRHLSRPDLAVPQVSQTQNKGEIANERLSSCVGGSGD